MAKHNDIGQWGEQIACETLIAEGAVIRERNWRQGHHEVDIIASTADLVIFAEVKTRTDPDTDPLEAVNAKKIRNLVNAANAYLKMHDIPFGARFDVIAINGTPFSYTVDHIKDAFYPPLRTYR